MLKQSQPVDILFEEIEAMMATDDSSLISIGEERLKQQDQESPDDAHIQYLIASTFDSLGREAEAMPHYSRAFEIGIEQLPAHRQPEIFVQAGSTLRNLNRFDEARHILQQGIDRFPHYRALRVFLALLEAGLNNSTQAMHLLFKVIVMEEDASLKRYNRSLNAYVKELTVKEV